MSRLCSACVCVAISRWAASVCRVPYTPMTSRLPLFRWYDCCLLNFHTDFQTRAPRQMLCINLCSYEFCTTSTHACVYPKHLFRAAAHGNEFMHIRVTLCDGAAVRLILFLFLPDVSSFTIAVFAHYSVAIVGRHSASEFMKTERKMPRESYASELFAWVVGVMCCDYFIIFNTQ